MLFVYGFFSAEQIELVMEPQVQKIMLGPQLSGAIDGWLGFDALGRSLFYQLALGAFWSLGIGLLGCVGTSLLGFSLGAFAAWHRGWIERGLVRCADIFSALPGFLLSAVFCLFLQVEFPQLSSIFLLCAGLILTHWMSLFRVARGLVNEAKQKDWVIAARALGASDFRILWQHIWPNMRSQFLTVAGLQIPSLVLYESYMSFIGLGVSSPQVTWGLLIKEGWKSLSDFPHVMIFPSFFLFMSVWSFHVLLDSSHRGR